MVNIVAAFGFGPCYSHNISTQLFPSLENISDTEKHWSKVS